MKRDRTTTRALTSTAPWETLTLTTLSRDRHLFAALLSEARQLASQRQEGKTVVYTRKNTEWAPFGKPRAKREIASVVLDEGVAEGIQADLKRFLGRKAWYAERGQPSNPCCLAKAALTPAVSRPLGQASPTDEATSCMALQAQANPPSSKLSQVRSATTFAS